MPIFERGESDGAEITVDFAGGLCWMAHPDEEGQRSSHAIKTADGVWLLDPIDAPNVEERIASLGEVAGVAVLSWYHGPSATLVAPDSPGTIDRFRVGDEHLGFELLRRLQAPDQLAGLDPERILVGHGSGIIDHAGSALREGCPERPLGFRGDAPLIWLANDEHVVG